MTRSRAATIAAIVVLAIAAGCSGTPGDTGRATTAAPPATGTTVPPGPPTVVASTPLVGALVRSVGGDEVELEVLVESGADATTATVADPDAALDGADLFVLIDDETFEQGLSDVVEAASDAATEVIALAPQLSPIPLGGSQLDPGSSDADGATDPHVWLDTDRWTQAARLVADELVELGVDPAVVQANVAAFDEGASTADEGMQALFAVMPEDRRVAGTDLGGLGYLADRYGIELIFATDPAALGGAVAARGVTAVFTSPAGIVTTAPAVTAAAPDATIDELDLDASGLGEVPPAAGGATQIYVSFVLSTSNEIVTTLMA